MEIKNNGGSTLAGVVIAVLLIATLALSGFIVYDKFIKEDEVVQNDNGNNDNNNPVVEEKEVKAISAYSFNGKVKYTGTCGDFGPTVNANVDLPKIDSDKANALVLNQRILNDFSRFTKLENGTSKSNIDISYKYLIKDKYIFIYVEGNAGNPCGSGYHAEKSYYYDITNDVIMNNQEAYKAAGLSIENLKNDTSYEADHFSGCDAWGIDGCGCGLKIENNKLVPYYVEACL